MPTRSLLRRIDRAEAAAKGQFKFSADCICFPQNEPPFVGFLIEAKIAAQVKCPVHGERIGPMGHLYVSQWRRRSEEIRRQRLSAQYHKAWLASFPPDLWPAEEEETEDGRTFLRSKDGTRLLAYEPAYPKCQGRPAV